MEIIRTTNPDNISVLLKKNTNKTTYKKTLDKQRDIWRLVFRALLWNLTENSNTGRIFLLYELYMLPFNKNLHFIY